MATLLKLGPSDHGRPLSLEEFTSGDYAEGYRYELIDGWLEVSPAMSEPANWVQEWVSFHLKLYTREHPEVINHVSSGARVFVTGRPRTTIPEPDLAAYRDFPLDRRVNEVRWQDVSPVLVVEIISEEDPDKDLVRNAALYLQVPSIKEYWVFDARKDADSPDLVVHRHHGRHWRVRNLAGGSQYTTRLLPDFMLTLDTRI